MVAGKPATNSLQLTSQQTGTLLPGESVHVSFVFHATSIGRWTHDLAVRNLGNKHDQASDGDMLPFRLELAPWFPGVEAFRWWL